MTRQWKVWDDWSGGGFFSGGSYNAKDRFNALNLQRYQNGSIGPRPGWRKMTQSDLAAAPDSVPSVSNANKATLQQGSYWAPSGNYVVLIGSGSGGPSKRIDLSGANGTAVYRDAPDIGYHATSAADIKSIYSANQLNGVQGVIENNSFVNVGGSNLYNALTNALSSVTARTISGNVLYPTNVCFYKGRLYGWVPISVLGLQYVLYTDAADLTNFASGDSGSFTLAGVTSGSNAAYIPYGLWPVGSGLLIFAIGGSGTFQQPGYTGYATPIAEHGRWFVLTGFSDKSGTLTPLERDIGPLFYSQSIVHDNKLLFPVDRAGWAVHDGTKLDKVSLADLRPGRGQFIASSVWLSPVRTVKKSSLVLPFYIYESDPTATTATSDEIGEFWNYGLGAFEYINGSWTEHLYLHGQADIINHGQFLDDKLFAIHLDSADAGANWFPQIYTRDTTLNRPATTSSQNTYNPYSDGQETAPTQAGGATGDMVCRLETGEFNLPGFSSLVPDSIVIDYDYWNSSLFHSSTCGFDVYLVMRSITNNEKIEQKVNISRVTPPGTSSGVVPKRARAVLNLPARYQSVGSIAVRLDDIDDCAIYSVALGYEGPGLDAPIR